MLGHLHTTLIIAAVASMILTGCGGGQEALRTPTAGSGRSQRKDVEKRPMAFYESTLRPSIFDGDVDSVRKVHEQELEQQVLLIPRDSLTFQEETILGFRIQVASTSSIDDAATVKAAAQDLFRIDTVYVVYDRSKCTYHPVGGPLFAARRQSADSECRRGVLFLASLCLVFTVRLFPRTSSRSNRCIFAPQPSVLPSEWA